MQEQLLVSRRGESPRRAGRAGARARGAGARPDRSRRRPRCGARACEGPGARRVPDRRRRGHRRRQCYCRRRRRCRRRSRDHRWLAGARFHLRAARDEPVRLRQSLPADHHRPAAAAEGRVMRHLGGGLRAGGGAHRTLGRRPERADPRRRAARGHRADARGVRRPAVRDGEPASPCRRGSPGGKRAPARRACRSPAGRRHRGAVPHTGAPRSPGRSHLHRPRCHPRHRRPADQAERRARSEGAGGDGAVVRRRAGAGRAHARGGIALRLQPVRNPLPLSGREAARRQDVDRMAARAHAPRGRAIASPARAGCRPRSASRSTGSSP